MDDVKVSAAGRTSASLAGRRVVVIGGTSGIGFAVATAALSERAGKPPRDGRAAGVVYRARLGHAHTGQPSLC